METSFFLIIIIGLVIGNAIAIFVILRKTQSGHAPESFHLLNQNIQGMQGRLDTISQGLNQRLDNAANVIQRVSRELGTMQEIGRNMQSLQDFLKSPKLRGNIGEKILQQMLDQSFPHHLYEMQYRFRDGQMVDAVVKTDHGLIPIDAKFPMENYQRAMQAESEEERESLKHEFMKDVKKHVDSIAKKYILPDEGTVDFAIMYIPSESVYYEIIRHDMDLHTHALHRKILFVSPNSFYYFLRVIMMGMQGKRIADATREILATINGLQKDAARFHETLQVVNTHVSHSKSALDRAETEFTKLENKIQNMDQIEGAKNLLPMDEDV